VSLGRDGKDQKRMEQLHRYLSILTSKEIPLKLKGKVCIHTVTAT